MILLFRIKKGRMMFLCNSKCPPTIRAGALCTKAWLRERGAGAGTSRMETLGPVLAFACLAICRSACHVSHRRRPAHATHPLASRLCHSHSSVSFLYRLSTQMGWSWRFVPRHQHTTPVLWALVSSMRAVTITGCRVHLLLY